MVWDDRSNIYFVPFATIGLIALNGLIGLGPILFLRDQQLAHFFMRFGVSPASFIDPALMASQGLQTSSVFSVLTHMFLHANEGHLIGNMWMLWVFADNVEEALDTPLFLAVYLISGLAALAAHVLANLHSPVPVIGASGAIAGMMGAYLYMFPNNRMSIVFVYQIIRFPAWVFVGLWFIEQVVSGLLSDETDGVAWWAHVGGFAAGMLMARICCYSDRFACEKTPPGVLVEHQSGLAILLRREAGDIPMRARDGMVRHEDGLGVSAVSEPQRTDASLRSRLGLVHHDRGIRILGRGKKPPRS
ncbi:MAG: rhomboid family intramembrane serine protease [Proteobacteria bacterium]|nr:rhomboid family intramembrane serine protease [Pseudomonadota bacterium]